MPDTFGDNELTPDDARKFIKGLCAYMQRRSHNLAASDDSDVSYKRKQDDETPAKQYYGDAWTLLYGITKAVEILRRDSKQSDNAAMEEWERMYENYGYGAYGDGMEVGKRLAFYEGRDFEFTEYEDEDENKPDFEFNA